MNRLLLPESRPGIRRGVLLLHPEPWVRAELGRDLAFLERDPRLDAILGAEAPKRLTDALQDEHRAMLAAIAPTLAEGECSTAYLVALGGRPIEALLCRRGDRFDAFLRSAANRIARMEDLVFFYRSFLASTNAVMFCDAQARIVDVNRRFLDLFSYRLPDIVGQHPSVLRSDRQDPAVFGRLWQAVQDPAVGSWQGEIVARTSASDELTILLSVSSVRDEEGRLLGFIGSAIDISERKQIELELQAKNEELERLNALKNELMTVTSHDLKSPLAAMVSYATLVREGLVEMPRERAQGLLDEVIGAGHRLARFIDDLLDIQRIESGRTDLTLARVRLDSVVRSCAAAVEAVARDHGVEIDVRVSGRRPRPITGDIVKMERVLHNLLSNAVKFAPPGSTVLVEYQTTDEVVEISVSDAGPGIPEDALEKVFDRYYQVPGPRAGRGYGKGTGLGLAIARGIIERHGGRIWAENRAGGGCRMVLWIPFHAARGLAAMIVERDDRLRRVLGAPLEVQEVDVFHARHADEVRRIVEYERPLLVFVNPDAEVEAQAAVADVWRSSDRPPLVVLLRDPAAPVALPSLPCRILETPVLDAEILALVREARLRTGGTV